MPYFGAAMEINKALDEVNDLITQLSSPEPPATEVSIDLYARVFDLLLKDSEHSDNIFNKIKTSNNPSDIQRYVQTLKSLNTMVNSLDSTHPLKKTLQERLADNVNLSSITKFEKNYTSNPQAAATAFISANKYPNVLNTVEVRTWGTQREYSNGLRNVVEQKLRQDDVGHAAVVMRVPADEEGLRLIRQYCMDDKGKAIIPHELKKIGDQVVYEIYWSYWPGTLHTQEQDYEHERRGLEYRDIKELDRNVPKELSDKYIVHKYRKGQVVPFAAAMERATVDSTQEVSSERSRYLDLKEREIKLEEQIETIDVMLENYLDTGKPYSPAKKFADEAVRKKSNFYEILSRFKNELQPRSIAAKILANETISTADAKKLKSAFESLKKAKNKEIELAKTQMESIAPEIQVSYEKAKALEKQVSERASAAATLGDITNLRAQKKEVSEIQASLREQGNVGYPIVLTAEMRALIGKHEEKFTSYEEGEHYTRYAIDRGEIQSEEELLSVLEEFKNYETEIGKNIGTLERDEVRDVMMERVALFKNEREHAQQKTREQLQGIEDNIVRLKLQVEELNALIPSLSGVSPLDAIKEIGQLEKNVKDLDKLSKSFKGEQDFSYKVDGGDIKVRLTSIEDVKALKDKISEIHSERKKELPELREKIKKGEKTLEHSKDRDGAPIAVRSLQDATALRDSAQKELGDLVAKQKTLQENLQLSKLRPTTHLSEITQKQIRRGYPFHSSTVNGFNIEEMLKVAKPLSGTVKNFQLKIENCSTTSMKLLHAGSPEFKKAMFVGSKPPVIKTPYKFEIKPDDPDAPFKPDTVYFKQVNGGLTYSLLDKDGVKQEDVLLPNAVAPEPFDVKELEVFRKQVLKDIGDQGFSEDFEYDGEAFLTNPQAVYAAARVYERMDAGDKQAIKVAEHMLDPNSRNETYNRLINKLSSKSNDELTNLQKNKKSMLSLAWEFIKHPTALYRIYQDYKNPIKEENPELVAVESQLRDIESSIRGLNSDNKYMYINSGTPAVAINKMLEVLNSSPKAIPFFTKEKLEEVDNYIFQIAQKEKPTPEEKATLRAFDRILEERDTRIKTVEKALANGRDVTTQLESSASNSKITNLKFPFTDKDLAQHKVDVFIKKYTEDRESQLFTFARSNFVTTLDKLKTAEEKLAAIVEHVEKNPHSRSAQIWKEHIETDPVLLSVMKERERRQQPRPSEPHLVVSEGLEQEHHLHELLGMTKEKVASAKVAEEHRVDHVDKGEHEVRAEHEVRVKHEVRVEHEEEFVISPHVEQGARGATVISVGASEEHALSSAEKLKQALHHGREDIAAHEEVLHYNVEQGARGATVISVGASEEHALSSAEKLKQALHHGREDIAAHEEVLHHIEEEVEEGEGEGEGRTEAFH